VASSSETGYIQTHRFSSKSNFPTISDQSKRVVERAEVDAALLEETCGDHVDEERGNIE
jgi:hypothetical protein